MIPPDDLIPHLLAASDVLGTGWYAGDAARVRPGQTVVVVGDGAVGLMAVLAAKQMGAESVLECVGTDQSMKQAMAVCRPGGSIGYVGVPHGVQFDGQQLFFTQQNMLGGPAPVRRFLPDLMRMVLARDIEPGDA